jgi:hypothetical protein
MKPPKARRDVPRNMKGTEMKADILTTIALLTAFAIPALADGDKTLGGCALIDKGGYYVKADADCVFSFAGNETGQETDLGDYDNDPSTPPTRG